MLSLHTEVSGVSRIRVLDNFQPRPLFSNHTHWRARAKNYYSARAVLIDIVVSSAISIFSTVPLDQYVLDVMSESLLATLPQPVSNE